MIHRWSLLNAGQGDNLGIPRDNSYPLSCVFVLTPTWLPRVVSSILRTPHRDSIGQSRLGAGGAVFLHPPAPSAFFALSADTGRFSPTDNRRAQTQSIPQQNILSCNNIQRIRRPVPSNIWSATKRTGAGCWRQTRASSRKVTATRGDLVAGMGTCTSRRTHCRTNDERPRRSGSKGSVSAVGRFFTGEGGMRGRSELWMSTIACRRGCSAPTSTSESPPTCEWFTALDVRANWKTSTSMVGLSRRSPSPIRSPSCLLAPSTEVVGGAPRIGYEDYPTILSRKSYMRVEMTFPRVRAVTFFNIFCLVTRFCAGLTHNPAGMRNLNFGEISTHWIRRRFPYNDLLGQLPDGIDDRRF